MAAARRALKAAAWVSAIAGATFVAGPLQDRYLEWFLHRELDGKCYGTVAQLTEERSHRRSAVVPDELLAEIHSAAKHMGCPIDRIKLVLVPMSPLPASTGTRIFPGSHAYLVLSDGMGLNCLFGGARLAWRSSFPATHASPGECNIEPNQQYLTLTPADRYGIAHELSHIKHEDYVVRWMVQTACVVGILAIPPLAMRTLGWSRKAASIPSMLAIIPSFFGFKKLSRTQEARADLEAAQRGYARGGVEFWRGQLELGVGRRGISELYLDHPPPLSRLAMMLKYATPEEKS